MWKAALTSGGPREAARLASKHFLHTQTLEALTQMRQQLADMLADIHLIRPHAHDGHGHGHEGSAASSRAAWLDDPTAPWNKYSKNPLVVGYTRIPMYHIIMT